MTMSEEHAALVMLRTKARFKAGAPRLTNAEAAEDYAAHKVKIAPAIWLALRDAGLIEWRNGYELTDAGVDQLRASRGRV